MTNRVASWLAGIGLPFSTRHHPAPAGTNPAPAVASQPAVPPHPVPAAGNSGDASANAGRSTARRLREVLQTREVRETRVLKDLCKAAERVDLEMVRQCLRNRNFDPSQRAANGCTALYLAANNGHAGIVHALLDDDRIDPNRADDNQLQLWLRKNRLDVVTILLNHRKVDADWTDATGQTLLHKVTREGRFRWARALLSRADPNKADNNGVTPLHLAAQYDHRIARLLLEKGATVNFPDRNGATALLHAAQSQHREVLEEAINMLLVAGANPHIPDNQGRSPFQAIVERGHLGAFNKMLEKGVDPDESEDYETLIRSARLQGHEAITDALKLLCWRKASSSGDYAMLARGAKPASSLTKVEADALEDVAGKRNLTLRPSLRLVEANHEVMAYHREATLNTIAEHPALFQIGTRFASAQEAFEAICDGSSPWKIMSMKKEEDIVVTGTLLGYGESNSRIYAQSWFKNGFARADDFNPRKMEADYQSHMRQFMSHRHVGSVVPPGTGFLAQDSEETSAIIRKFLDANNDVNSGIQLLHQERLKTDPNADPRDTRAEFVLNQFFEPAVERRTA
ncbi:MAG: ankyrin-3-like isoform [Burkholderia sp.]|nr:ankyrin-3-like isoform [Burkholderia sp.]